RDGNADRRSRRRDVSGDRHDQYVAGDGVLGSGSRERRKAEPDRSLSHPLAVSYKARPVHGGKRAVVDPILRVLDDEPAVFPALLPGDDILSSRSRWSRKQKRIDNSGSRGVGADRQGVDPDGYLGPVEV